MFFRGKRQPAQAREELAHHLFAVGEFKAWMQRRKFDRDTISKAEPVIRFGRFLSCGSLDYFEIAAVIIICLRGSFCSLA